MRLEEIDLTEWRNQKVYVGREAGAVCREHFDLDTLDPACDKVRVTVPVGVFSVNSSFFLGMFGPSIRALGAKGFREKFEFVGKNISRTVDDGIRHALDTSSPLSVA